MADYQTLRFTPYLMSNKKQLQRLARNTSEKKRKDKIKLGIKKISSLLPEAYKDPKDNYVILLDKTVNYIEELKNHNEQLLMGDRQGAQELEIERLQKQVLLLQKQLKEAQELFQQFGPNFSMDIARAIANWRGKENSGKKGLEKCLSTILNSMQTSGGIQPEQDSKKGKKNHSPTVSEHLKVTEGVNADNETTVPLLHGIIPTLLPDSTVPQLSGGIPGFSPTQPVGSVAGAGVIPMLPTGVSSALTVPQLPSTGLSNTSSNVYGSAPPVPVLTSTGKIVFLSPNSAHQQGLSNDGHLNSIDNHHQAENQIDMSQSSFSEAEGTSTPAHRQVEGDIKSSDCKKDLSMDISDNPLLDPDLQTLSTSIEESSSASPALVTHKDIVSASGTHLCSALVQPTVPGSIITSSTAGVPTLQPPQSIAMIRPTQTVTNPNVSSTNPGQVQGTFVVHNGQLLLINRDGTAVPGTLPSIPSTTTAVGSAALNNVGLLQTNLAPNLPLSSTAVTTASTSLSVGTTLTPSTGIKMTATVNQGPVPNIPCLQTQNVLINGQQQTVQVVPNQNLLPPAQNGQGQGLSNQTVTINTPQGQVTMNTTPSQPNQLPSALILPTGQIVPVVTQPQMLFPQNQCVPVNGGLLMAGSHGQPGAAVPTVSQVSQTIQGAVAGKSVIGQTVIGPNVRPVMGGQPATIRLPNGLLATVPQNNAIIRSQGNIIRTGTNTVHHLPGTANAGTMAAQPIILGSQAGQLATKPTPSLPGQPIYMPPGTAVPGQIIMGPNGSMMQSFASPQIGDRAMASMAVGIAGSQQVPVATSGDTVPTSTTTESKPSSVPTTTGSSTTSISTVPSSALPQTVTAMLTPDGNIIIMPVTNPSAPVANPAPASSQTKATGIKSKKNRALKPKPSSGGTASTTETTNTSSGTNPDVGSPVSNMDTVGQQTSLPSSVPLSVSTEDSVTLSNSVAPSSTQDILAKATASIFSTSSADISPTMSGFYTSVQDDDNPLQIDTSSAQTVITDSTNNVPMEPPQSKPKPKRPQRKKNDSGKSSKTKKAKKQAGEETAEHSVDDEQTADVNLLEQLAEKMDDEEESDITDFSDLIKLHDHTMSEDKREVEGTSTVKANQNQHGVDAEGSCDDGRDMTTELPSMPLLIPASSEEMCAVSQHIPSNTAPQMPTEDKNTGSVVASASQENSISDMMMMPGLHNSNSLPGLVQPSTTSSPSMSQFSELSFLCAVAEQHQQEQEQQQQQQQQQEEQQQQQEHQHQVHHPQDQELSLPTSQHQATSLMATPGQESQVVAVPGKKSKSKKDKKKKDKKKKDKDRDRDKESLADGSALCLSGAVPGLEREQEGSGSLESGKPVKAEKEKKKKKNKKKDKDKSGPTSSSSVAAPADTSGSTVEENTLGSLFSNLDQSISAPQFFDMPDNTASTLQNANMATENNLLCNDSAADTSIDTSMEVEESGKKTKSKSKSKRSRNKKKGKDAAGDVPTSASCGRGTSDQTDRNLSQMDIDKALADIHTMASYTSTSNTSGTIGVSQSAAGNKVTQANSKKQEIRPEDIIPEAITFSENELCDVLDQVESLGQTLENVAAAVKDQAPGKRNNKMTDDIIGSPPAKRAKLDADEQMDRIVIIPSAKKADERVPEEKLDEIFGPKNKNENKKNDVVKAVLGDVARHPEEVMDVFEFETCDMENNQALSKKSPEKKEKKKSKKSKKKNKEQQQHQQQHLNNDAQAMDVDLTAKDLSDEPVSVMDKGLFNLDKSGVTEPTIQDSPVKLIDSITSMMNQNVDDALPAPNKSPKKVLNAYDQPDTFSSTEKSNGNLDKVNSGDKLDSGSSGLLDKEEDKSSSMNLSSATNIPSSARHSNIFSLAHHMAPPKYGPIVQPKTPKPAHPPLNLSSSDNQLPSSRVQVGGQCSRSLNDSPKPSILEQKAKEHDLASSLPDELDIPDIVEENALRESELSREMSAGGKHDRPQSPVNKHVSGQEQDPFRTQGTPVVTENVLSAVPSLQQMSSPTSLSYASDPLFSQGRSQNKEVNQGNRLKQCRESPVNSQQQSSTGSLMSAPNRTTSMGNNGRDAPGSGVMSSGQSNMFAPPPPVTTSSSCALQGHQLEHYPYSVPPFPLVSNSSSSSRSSCSVNASNNETPFCVSFSSSSTTSTSSAYDTRNQFPSFYHQPFLPPVGPKGVPGAIPPTPLGPGAASMASQMGNLDMPAYGGTNSSGNMEIPASKHGSMHNNALNNQDKSQGHGMGQSQNAVGPPVPSSMHSENSAKSREREQTRQNHATSLPPPPQLSHPDKSMTQSGSSNRLPTPTHSQGQNMSKQRSSSIGRSPQEAGQYMGPAGSGFHNQSPSGGMPSASSSLTSPPLHHPRPPSEPQGSVGQHGGYEPLMFPGSGPASQFSPVPSFSVYDPPPLHFTKESSMPSQGNSSYSQSRTSSSNMSNKAGSQGQRQSQGHSHGHGTKNMGSHKQQSHHSSQQQSHHPQSHHTSQQQSHHASQQQQQQQQQHSHNPSTQSKSSSSRSKSKKSSSSNTKQLQHYEGDSSGAMFDPSRSMTPYFPISNLSPQPRNLPSDGPTYLPGNFFGNAGRPLSNANSLQHKDPAQLNNPFQSFFPPPSRGAQNGLFQAPPFGMNHMHAAAAGNHSSPSQISQHSSSVSMAPHMPNFNLTNLFSDMSNPSQSDISPMKFPPGNAIIPPQGSGMDHNAMHHHQAAAGSLYHNRSQVPPPMLHNVAFNSILGHQHGFDARGMTPGMNSSVGGPFAGPGHAPSFGMPHLNFPMHDH
ncbi:hypothetical protein LSH36_345g00004 [Paralvinella palmiformis]|uniref:BHLH domain-containing protein n=1 Tax=Paralvinella palmiformis TaxID=53620 RepID=A0AAD9JGD2_9ANNE|nr:hypothetical protein LSH36_345g00004 [Paralvinella palmiformis]